MKFREISRDPRQILSRETCDTILSQATAGVLSVLGDGGYPYGVPINYAYCNRKIYFHGMPSGHKFDAMQRHNQVSLTVIDKDTIVPEEYTSYFRSVIVFGHVHQVEDMQEKIQLCFDMVEKYAPDYLEAFQKDLSKFEKRISWMGAFVIDPDHISGKEAIELAVPGWKLEELQ